MSDFKQQLADLTSNLDRSRSELLGVLSNLSDSDLDRARRGGWTVGKVLDHIISAEWHYAELIASLRGANNVQREQNSSDGVAGVSQALSRSRSALMAALQGVAEEEFYRLSPVGREEYSVVSVLENVEQHDIEHLGQINSIQSST